MSEWKPLKISTVSADDWTAWYINGELQDQGHSFRVDSILNKLQELGLIEYDSSLEDHAVAYKYADEFGNFPQQYDSIRALVSIE